MMAMVWQQCSNHAMTVAMIIYERGKGAMRFGIIQVQKNTLKPCGLDSTTKKFC